MTRLSELSGSAEQRWAVTVGEGSRASVVDVCVRLDPVLTAAEAAAEAAE